MDAILSDFFTLTPPLVLAATLLGSALFAGFLGHRLRLHYDLGRAPTSASLRSEGQEGYIVSGVLGLLALIMGFTLAMSVERFEARRQVVLEEANAIGTAYLRSQLLGEPHRTRLSRLLVEYTDNRLVLATADP